MALGPIAIALSMLVASQTMDGQPAQASAPTAPPEARYCLRVDPAVGSNMETIRCETRAEWSALDVDVDKEWASWGVKVVTGMPGYRG